MRKFFAIFLLFIAVILLCFLFFKTSTFPKGATIAQNTPTKNPLLESNSHVVKQISQKMLFVPYWATDSVASGFATYIYFGIIPSDTGIDTTDPGFANLPAFVALTQGSTTLLTVRMLNNDNTQKALQDKVLAENIVQDTIQTAHTYGFDGVVLDLEYSGLAFPSVTKQVTDFSTRFAQEVKARNLSFYQALYGDSFYLARPFDVGQIAQNADGIFVLAYDFHKANGTPGPNFPLLSREDSDYNFSTMLSDFSKVVAKDKLTIIFGMFGYDWTIDSKGRPEKAAESLSDTDLSAKFLTHCLVKQCHISRDPQTQEPSITYIDANGENHIVWFEDMQSVIKKEMLIQHTGISRIGFWANGYF